MKPTVGRIVLYTNLGDREGRFPPQMQAALITRVRHRDVPARPEEHEEHLYDVSLRIFYESGDFMMKEVPYSNAEPGSEEARGCWGWPLRA